MAQKCRCHLASNTGKVCLTLSQGQLVWLQRFALALACHHHLHCQRQTHWQASLFFSSLPENQTLDRNASHKMQAFGLGNALSYLNPAVGLKQFQRRKTELAKLDHSSTFSVPPLVTQPNLVALLLLVGCLTLCRFVFLRCLLRNHLRCHVYDSRGEQWFTFLQVLVRLMNQWNSGMIFIAMLPRVRRSLNRNYSKIWVELEKLPSERSIDPPSENLHANSEFLAQPPASSLRMVWMGWQLQAPKGLNWKCYDRLQCNLRLRLWLSRCRGDPTSLFSRLFWFKGTHCLTRVGDPMRIAPTPLNA